jgi:hypothetical protein
MALIYGHEKFFAAVYGSIGSSASLQERLCQSYIFNIINVRREDVPSDEIWIRIEKLAEAVTCKPAQGEEGTVAATTSQMTDEEAAEWLHEIASIFNEIAEACGAGEYATQEFSK